MEKPSPFPIPRDGWTASLVRMPSISCRNLDDFWIRDASNDDGRPAGAVRGKEEGYTMWRDEHVRSVKVNYDCTDAVVVSAGDLWPKGYDCFLWLDSCTGSVNGGYCACKSEAGGYCKHIAALFYQIWDLHNLGLESVPPEKAVTEVPAYWIERGAPLDGGNLTFNDIVVAKHGAPPVGLSEPEVLQNCSPRQRKREVEQRVCLLPKQQIMSSGTIRGLCKSLEEIGSSFYLTSVLRLFLCERCHCAC